MVEKRHLGEELAQCARLDVVIVRLADFPHPAVRRAVMADLEVERLEHDTLALEDLVSAVTLPSHGNELVDRRRKNFLVLRRNEHGGDTNELEFHQGNDAFCQEAVDDVDGDPERFREQVVAQVYLEQPVDQGLPHLPVDLSLTLHVVRVGHDVLLHLT